MLEVQAVLGRMQLRKLDAWIARRRENAAYLAEKLGHHPALRIPHPGSEVGHAYYKFYAFINSERLRDGWSRDRIMQEINEEGIPCYSGSCSEIYLEKAFDRDNLRPRGRLPVARELGETSLMFLVHPTLGQEEMQQTADAVLKVLNRASI
jgi:dTDP-4-amino-4,6-dideoxygalactose transaminase